jgi:hypothetical protein
MATQVDAVRKALGEECAAVPVHSMVCFVDAQWGWFAKTIELGGVLVTWPKAMREVLVAPGPFGTETVATMAARLDRALRPAS